MLQEVGRDAWVRALTEHRRLLRATYTAQGGVEVEMLGESSHFAFPSAQDAVAAAVAGQRALQEHLWESQPIKVRVGVHTGEPTQAEGQYAGLDVHQAARVMGAGHGGQVLVSQRTAEIVGGELAGEIELVDLGEHRLKDLSAPQRLYQAVGAGLPATFPPLKTLHVSSLPVQASRLIGRQSELSEIQLLLGDQGTRLLTLIGPGGTGKTRLALQAAEDVIEQFEGGAHFVPLAALHDPALVLPTIATTLGVREQAGRSFTALLSEHLGPKRNLLVLDNFEQIIEAAPAIASLLDVAPTVSVLVTSREPLRIGGEHCFAVPGLRLPRDSPADDAGALLENDAVVLFAERARAAGGGFALGEDNAAAIATICTLLDGLPLAIELAAARVDVLSPQAMVERLDRSLDLLTKGRRDADERQQTLRSTIQWSYDLLTNAEQQAFARLSVFPSGFGLDAAESVCGAGLDELSALAEQSLLRRETAEDDATRFRFLRVIREFALESLIESGSAAEVRRRHAAWCLDLGRRADVGYRGDDAAAWLARVEVLHDDFRAALSWAREIGDRVFLLDLADALSVFWQAHGHLTEASAWYDEVLADAETLSEEQLLQALQEASTIAYRAGDYDRVGPLAERQLAVSRQVGNQRGVVFALSKLASLAVEDGQLERGRSLHAEAVTTARDAGDERALMAALSNLGNLELLAGEHDRAARVFDEALELTRSSGRPDSIATALFNVGLANVLAGDTQQAAVPLQESLQLSQELGDREGVAYGVGLLAAVAAAEHRQRDAAVLLGAADALLEAAGASLESVERALHERTEASVRAALGEEADVAWNEGRGMTADDLVKRVAAGTATAAVRIP